MHLIADIACSIKYKFLCTSYTLCNTNVSQHYGLAHSSVIWQMSLTCTWTLHFTKHASRLQLSAVQHDSQNGINYSWMLNKFVITPLERKARVATSMYPMERHAFNVRRFGTSLGPGEALDNKFGYRLELPH